MHHFLIEIFTTLYLRVFSVADCEFDLKIQKWKMAVPIWQNEINKVD